MSAFQPQVAQQPVSIDWHVRDGTNDGILKVYLFQKIPESNPIVRWKNALVEKLNQYNRANHANRGLFTENADGSTTSDYQDQSYTLGPLPNQANYRHFHALHAKYRGDFCGDEMNPGYINIAINTKNYICMFVTDSSTGEEKLHSVVIFYFKSTSSNIYIDIFCTSTIPGYVNFRGGYRLMSLLYGICRLLGLDIELHSLDAAIEFYKNWGYREIRDTTKSLPKFVSSCAPRNKMSFQEVGQYVVEANRIISGIKGFAGTPEQQEAFAKAQEDIKEGEGIKNSVFSHINILDRVNSGSTEAEAEAEAQAEPEVNVNAEVVFHNDDYWKVTNKVFDDKGKVISYDLYQEDAEGNMKMSLCVPAQNVETMDEHRKRLMSDKVRQATEYHGRRVFSDDFAMKSLKKKMQKQKSSNNGSKGGSRKPRKTKKRKTKRNSKKIYKAKNLI